MSDKTFDRAIWGISDEDFIRGKVPMTKEEIRALTLSKLRLKPGLQVLDIGAGTGSISLECAMIVHPGMVYGVEKKPEALSLMEKNREKFGVYNFNIVPGEAPEVLKEIPPVDRIIIGGSSGNMKEILDCCMGILKPGGRLVINAILLETAYKALEYMDEFGYINTDLILASISRGRTLGKKVALSPLNPIFILWGEKEE